MSTIVTGSYDKSETLPAEIEAERSRNELARMLAADLVDLAILGVSPPPVDAVHQWIFRALDERGLVPELPVGEPDRRAQADRAAAAAFRRIGERDGFWCRTCGAGRQLTVDHIIAVVNGGTDDDENLQILCRSHNSSKGAS